MSVLHRVTTWVRGFDVDEAHELVEHFGAISDIIIKRLASLEASTYLIKEAVYRIEKQLCNLPKPEPAKAICDNCKIDVILPAKYADRASDYIQNLGWSMRGEQLLCPGCTKIRESEES